MNSLMRPGAASELLKAIFPDPKGLVLAPGVFFTTFRVLRAGVQVVEHRGIPVEKRWWRFWK